MINNNYIDTKALREGLNGMKIADLRSFANSLIDAYTLLRDQSVDATERHQRYSHDDQEAQRDPSASDESPYARRNRLHYASGKAEALRDAVAILETPIGGLFADLAKPELSKAKAKTAK